MCMRQRCVFLYNIETVFMSIDAVSFLRNESLS